MPSAPTTAARGRIALGWLLLALLVAAGLAWFAAGGGAPPEGRNSQTAAAGLPAAPAAAPLGPATLDPELDPPVPPPDPDPRVYPPDHVRGRQATDAVVRGLLVAAREVAFPAEATIELQAQVPAAGLASRSARLQEGEREFRFDAVPFGDWKVVLSAHGYQTYEALITTSAESCDLHLVLPLQYANRIAGRVLDEHGRPVADMAVCAEAVLADSSRAVAALRGISREDGEFEILGATPGRYRVHAGAPRSPLGAAREVQLAGAEAWIDLVVPLTGGAAVTFRDLTSGAPLAEIKVVATRVASLESGSGFSASAVSTAEGRATFTHLPPGEYTFTAYGSDRRRTVTRARVEADQVTQVPIALALLPPR